MLTTLDYVILVAYVVGVAVFGILVGGRQRSTTDYFLGGRNLPWWAVCFSVVATETSTLTVIGVPAVAYGGSMTFLQITLGYLLGRIAVAKIFLPRYSEGKLVTAYEFLGIRFGDKMRFAASSTFLVTRLLADGVRLFATAIPLKVIADLAGFSFTYLEIIAAIGLVTVIYTLIGGIRAVVWMDVVQMVLYLGGGIVALLFLLGAVPADWWQTAAAAGKTDVLFIGGSQTFASWFAEPYVLLTAVLGGAIFSMASHGTDQLIVQRLLTCRSATGGQKALVGSAFLVAAQFALFLIIGVLLWVYYQGQAPAEMGMSRGDEIFPRYIIEGLPPGLSGLLLAGIIAAAMSTLSSSLNSLASSSMLDIYQRIRRSERVKQSLTTARVITLFWGLLFVIFASFFEDTSNPVVELGLAIASFTYGGLLGAFLLGLFSKRTRQADAIVAFGISIATMVAIIFGVWYSPEQGWLLHLFPGDEAVAAGGLRPIGWPWYTVIGSVITVGLGYLLGLRHRQAIHT